jgi:hypothetical protein
VGQPATLGDRAEELRFIALGCRAMWPDRPGLTMATRATPPHRGFSSASRAVRSAADRWSAPATQAGAPPDFRRVGFFEPYVYEAVAELRCDELEEEARVAAHPKARDHHVLKIYVPVDPPDPATKGHHQRGSGHLEPITQRGEPAWGLQAHNPQHTPDCDQSRRTVRISKAQLRGWQDHGLPFVRVGRATLYAEASVTRWLLSRQQVEHPSEQPVKRLEPPANRRERAANRSQQQSG